jgi:hypothetical protein
MPAGEREIDRVEIYKLTGLLRTGYCFNCNEICAIIPIKEN